MMPHRKLPVAVAMPLFCINVRTQKVFSSTFPRASNQSQINFAIGCCYDKLSAKFRGGCYSHAALSTSNEVSCEAEYRFIASELLASTTKHQSHAYTPFCKLKLVGSEPCV